MINASVRKAIHGPFELNDTCSEVLDDMDGPNTVYIFDWEDRSLRHYGASSTPPTFDDFILFRGRLQKLQCEMHDWRPKRIRDLFRPGYGDRFMWYTQIFALLIATMGTLGLFLSILQTVYSIKSYYENIAVSVQSLEVALMSLNVSLTSLALQKLQMNVTI
jgi:hypothetical protein